MLADSYADDDRMSGSFHEGYVGSLNGNAAYFAQSTTGSKRKRVADEMETIGDSFLSRGIAIFI